MGHQQVTHQSTAAARATFLRSILEDLDTLEAMLERQLFDPGPPRIGAEQEFVLVDQHLNPALVAGEVLGRLSNRHFTTELGRFNLEANLTPRVLQGDCLTALRQELTELSTRARAAAKEAGAELLLTGILPTFEPMHAGLDQMTPSLRFAELNRATLASRGGRVQLTIQGIDALNVWHDNIMLEAGATSFQVHLQVAPQAFAPVFNGALLVAAPLVAACANSAILGGHRLWHETRIPLLEACGDVRSPPRSRRSGRSRTSLGEGWVERSVLEVYRRDLARFESIIAVPKVESSAAALQAGRVPALRALSTFNGTIWRWIRPCYGITEGLPHLRIENRVLAAGPTIADEIANAALWLGLMIALPVEYGDVRTRLDFADADFNFHAAARWGLDAELRWLDGERIGARRLLLRRLLPLAEEGLRAAGVDESDVTSTLGIIEERVRSGRTGAAWMLQSCERLPRHLSRRERAWRLTSAMAQRCWSAGPVHRWPVAPEEQASVPRAPPAVAVALRTDFFSLRPDAPLDLAERILSWERMSHLVVEDASGSFMGVVSAEDVQRCRRQNPGLSMPLVSDALGAHRPPLRPTQSIPEALAEMRRTGDSCRVILQGSHVAGLVFASDLERALKSATEPVSTTDELEPAPWGVPAEPMRGMPC